MTLAKVTQLLRRVDPKLVLGRSPKTGQWVAMKPVDTVVYQHPAPQTLPTSGVFVTKEVRAINQVMFQLPFGLCQRSVDHAHRMMFWKRGVSADEVADAMDRDDRMLDISKKRDRRNYTEAFQQDWGKQLRKKIKGEPTISLAT